MLLEPGRSADPLDAFAAKDLNRRLLPCLLRQGCGWIIRERDLAGLGESSAPVP